MALNGSFTGSSDNQYIQPKITWSATQSISGNYSDVTATLTYSRTNSGYTTFGTWTGGITIDGSRTPCDGRSIRITQNSNTFAMSATIRVYHDSDGSKKITISADGGIPGTHFNSTNCSKEVTLDTIPRQATIGVFSNGSRYDYFTDEDNPTVYYSNPAGSAVTVRTCMSWTGGDDIAYRDVVTTSDHYTFYLTDAERNKLRNATPDSTSRSVTIYITTWIGNLVYYSTKDVTFEVINCDPTLNPRVIDKGTSSTQFTGNPSTMIRGFNVMDVTFNASGNKGASIVAKSVTCGNQVKYDDGEFGYVYDNEFKFSVTDSRGKTTTETVTVPAINYIPPTCNADYVYKLNADNSANITITISGSVFNNFFGTHENAQYNNMVLWYKCYKSGETEPDWTIISHDNTSLTYNGNSYSYSINLANVPYKDVYIVKARVFDRINCINGIDATQLHVIIHPVFDWGKDDFNFNVPVTIEGKRAVTYGNDVIHRSYTQNSDIKYAADSYINFFQDNSEENFISGIATFTGDGLFTINWDATVLINIHISSSNTNGRSYIQLVNYNDGWKYTDCIAYGEFTTSQITIILKLEEGTRLGVKTIEPMIVNNAGLAGSYIEVMQL